MGFAMGGIPPVLSTDGWLVETSPEGREDGASCH